MTKKKKDEGLITNEVSGEYEISEVKEEIADKPVYYERATWKNVKKVFKCATCGTFRDDEDSMIEHVLLHVPKDKQEEVFNQLVKEK